MKKGLLTACAALCVASAFAGDYWTSEDYFNAEAVYTEWESVAANRQVSISEDSAWVRQGVSGLTDFNVDGVADAWECSGYGSQRYKLSTPAKTDVLVVNFDATKENWSTFKVQTCRWQGDNGAPTAESTNMSDYTLAGYMVDMEASENYIIAGEINVPADMKTASSKETFALRASVLDAHGHEWNAGGDPIDTITEFGKWVPFSIDYDLIRFNRQGNFEPNGGDGYSQAQWNMPRPNELWKGKVAAEAAGAKVPDPDGTLRMPIDFTKIIGVAFYFQPGQDAENSAQTGNCTFNGTIQMRNITVGKAKAAVKFVPGVAPESAISEVSAVEFNQEGANFSFEGNGALTTFAGQTVAKGEGSVVAPAAGLYILTVNGNSTVVTVK